MKRTEKPQKHEGRAKEAPKRTNKIAMNEN